MNINTLGRLLVSIILIIMLITVSVPSPAHAQQVQLLNPGFEDPLGATLTASGLAYRVYLGPIHEGSWAAQINDSSSSLTQWVPGAVSLARYEFWGWIYATSNATGIIEIDFYEIANETQTQLQATTILSATNTGGTYQQKSTSVRAPLETTDIRIRLRGTATSCWLTPLTD